LRGTNTRMAAPLAELVLLRHGQSAGNVARDLAIASEELTINIEGRDTDVPLSALGERQARALGRALCAAAPAPDVMLVSPYRRTQQTATLMLAAAGWTVPIVTDERLREKEFGVLERLTRWGIVQKFPAEVAARRRIGKFYYRPPGGESWVDVILRLRSVWESMRHDYAGRRVVIVAHQVIVLCMRYIVEGLNEEQLLAIDRAGEVANCGITRYVADGDRMKLVEYNSVAPLAQQRAPITAEPSAETEK
jgi:2,3-bisphosphoglycerate-dependent phosphoglycerate mutase